MTIIFRRGTIALILPCSLIVCTSISQVSLIPERTNYRLLPGTDVRLLRE
jgi:hypothetical protein